MVNCVCLYTVVVKALIEIIMIDMSHRMEQSIMLKYVIESHLRGSIYL